MKDILVVSEIKDDLKEKYSSKEWFRGISIGPTLFGLEYCINLHVSSPFDNSIENIPSEIDGVPVYIIFIDEYKPRE